MSDHYRTIAAPAEVRQKISRSEFLAIAFPAGGETEFFAALAAIEKKYFDAAHHCWAFRLWDEGDVRQRSSDAGEPGGSAGRPILGAIEAADLFDVAVVVVRWFGGVKLGTGGLSRAYRGTAAGALGRAVPLDRYEYTRFHVTVPFGALNTVYRLVDPPAVVLASEEFGEHSNTFAFDVRRSRAERFAAMLTENALHATRE
jgi:uncharacterized YigZ family protein